MTSTARKPTRAHQIGHSRLRREVPCSHYLASNKLSDIAPNSLILGVCGVNLESSNPDAEGWYVSDFYAFNTLLRGHGWKQTWLTPVSPNDLVKTYGDFSHGNPYEPRKVVLSKGIIDEQLITPPFIVPEGQMKETFFQVLEEYREESEASGAPIVVLLFAPVSPHIEEDEYYRIEYSPAKPATRDTFMYPSGQLEFNAFETAIKGLHSAIMIRPDCCSRMPDFKSLDDGTIRCPKTFVRQLARTHKDTCNGDWEMAQQGKFRVILRKFLENESPTPADIQEAYDFIEFRTSMMDLADEMVDRLGLPRPLGRRCIWWHRNVLDFKAKGEFGSSFSRCDHIWAQLKDGGIENVIPLRRSRGRSIYWPFTRPAYYIAAAMELAGWKSDQVAGAVAMMKEWKRLHEVQHADEDDENQEGWVHMDTQEEWVRLDRAKYWWKNLGTDELVAQGEESEVLEQSQNSGTSFGGITLSLISRQVSFLGGYACTCTLLRNVPLHTYLHRCTASQIRQTLKLIIRSLQ
ncbi:hypothetical protein QBC37DRAFT_402496 [Rhypophila decipiens]|uniref:Uncharacterized protein n=1 Tax=Rhypophila decipiens TaxID=261697 RepID=A0AAN6Y2I6_9PEZI|nr:hypothetical protein QBC37DRAFT_402496 [Rhypophila decipiens]